MNGVAAVRETSDQPGGANDPAVQRYRETLPETVAHEIVERGDTRRYHDTEPEAVPEGHLFVLGDNRYNSLNSRTLPQLGGLGFIPIENLIGRVTYIYWSGDLRRIGTSVE